MLSALKEKVVSSWTWEVEDEWNAKRVVHRVNGKVETLRYYRHRQVGDSPTLAGALLPVFDWVEVSEKEYNGKLSFGGKT